MKARPRIGPAVPAKKKRKPSVRYRLMRPGRAADAEVDPCGAGWGACGADAGAAEGTVEAPRAAGPGVRRVEGEC